MMTRISVRRKYERNCGCSWCLGHDEITRQIINLEADDMTDDQMDKLIRDRFPDGEVLDWRVWSEAEYMRSIRAKELPFAMVTNS